MSTRIVTLSGHMGSGKDTTANLILNCVPGSVSYAFADHLKKIALDIFGCSEEEVYGDKKEEDFSKYKTFNESTAYLIHGWVYAHNDKYSSEEFLNKSLNLARSKSVPWEFKTPRSLLQFLGTELLRDCYSTLYHVKQVEKRILDEAPPLAVITDARFPNERDWAKVMGAKTILVTGRTREDFNKENFNKHASETGMGSPSDYDFVIDNSGSMEHLGEQVFKLVDQL